MSKNREICTKLSGVWNGLALRTECNNICDEHEETKMFLQLRFDPETGRIEGEGYSVFRFHLYPCTVQGAFSYDLHHVRLMKSPSNGRNEQMYVLELNRINLQLNGTYLRGQVALQKSDRSISDLIAPFLQPAPAQTTVQDEQKEEVLIEPLQKTQWNEELVNVWTEQERHKYCSIFEQHGLDRESLLLATEKDIKTLNIPLGPRIKLMHWLGIVR
jgi:hypothetical protein